MTACIFHTTRNVQTDSGHVFRPASLNEVETCSEFEKLEPAFLIRRVYVQCRAQLIDIASSYGPSMSIYKAGNCMWNIPFALVISLLSIPPDILSLGPPGALARLWSAPT